MVNGEFAQGTGHNSTALGKAVAHSDRSSTAKCAAGLQIIGRRQRVLDRQGTARKRQSAISAHCEGAQDSGGIYAGIVDDGGVCRDNGTRNVG